MVYKASNSIYCCRLNTGQLAKEDQWQAGEYQHGVIFFSVITSVKTHHSGLSTSLGMSLATQGSIKLTMNWVRWHNVCSLPVARPNLLVFLSAAQRWARRLEHVHAHKRHGANGRLRGASVLVRRITVQVRTQLGQWTLCSSCKGLHTCRTL